jgi:hypothetical protein
VLGDEDQPLLTERARKLNQGDLLSTSHAPSLGAPESTFHPDTELCEPCPEQEVWAAPARPIRSGWGVIVTQTCDLVEPADREPWIQVSPLIDIGEDLWPRARDGRDQRAFSLPPIEGVDFPAIEPQVVFSVEKAALLHEGITTVATELDPAQRIYLSLWLARRCGRHAFPDLTEDLVLRPLRREIGKRFEQTSQVGAFTRSLLGIWATAGEGATIDVCFVLNPTLLRAHVAELGTDLDELDKYCQTLVARSAKRIQNSGSSLNVRAYARTLDRIDAHALLFEMRQVDMDLLPDNFFTEGDPAEATAAGGE